MQWYVFLIISMLAATSYTLINRKALSKSSLNPTGFSIVLQFSAAIAIGIYLLFAGLDTRWELIPKVNFFLGIFLWAIATMVLNHALSITQASLFNIIFSLRNVWVAAISVALLSEQLSLRLLIGLFVTFLASAMVVYDPNIQWDLKSLRLSLLTSVLFAFAVVNDGIVLTDDYSPISYFWFVFLFGSIGAALISRTGRESAALIVKSKELILISIVGVLAAVSGIAMFLAFQKFESDAPLSLISSINQIQTVLIAFGAIFVLGEKDHIPIKLIAAVLSTIGISILVS